MKGENNPNYGKEGPMRGKHHAKETREKISSALKGENNPNYGKVGYWKGKECENTPNYKYRITGEELYDLYIVQDLSAYRIAKMYGCSLGCILDKLKKYGIIKHGK